MQITLEVEVQFVDNKCFRVQIFSIGLIGIRIMSSPPNWHQMSYFELRRGKKGTGFCKVDER